MTKQEIMETLEGSEINSIQFENLVTVKEGKVIDCYTGKVHTPTKAQALELLSEAIRDEYGTDNMDYILKYEGII